jgi:pimeloyl-ACP methyl ester carboxylesterase
MSFEQIVDDLNARLPDGLLDLVGFSLGGYIAVYFAYKYPERVGSLLVVSNTPTQLPEAEVKQRNEILNWVESNGYKGMSKQRAQAMFEPSTMKKEWVETVLQMDAEMGKNVFLSQYRQTTQRLDLAPVILELTAPCRFLLSEHDPLLNIDWLLPLAEHNSNVNVEFIEGKGHMLPLEQAENLAFWINQSQ